MKIKLVVLFAIAFMTTSCLDSRKEARKIEAQIIEHHVIVIDECEYIYVSKEPVHSDFSITHKGNCKNPIHYTK